MRSLSVPVLSLILGLAAWLATTESGLAASRPCGACSHCGRTPTACRAREKCGNSKSVCSTCANCDHDKALCNEYEPCNGHETSNSTINPSGTTAATTTAGTGTTKTDKPRYFTLVLNCPAEARVTIGGQVTYASGETRQYQLQWDDKTRQRRLEMRLRDNDEQATYTFDHSIDCDKEKRLVLSVTRQQMTKVPDKHWTDEIAKRVKPNTVMVVTDDGKIEIKTPNEQADASTSSTLAKPSAVPTAPQTVLQRQIDQQSKRIVGWESELKKLQPELTTKTKHLEAVVKIRRQTEDAFLLKQHEVNAAVSNAPVLEARRLEAKKLELELNRAREQENEARTSLQHTQHVANDLEDSIKKGKQALAHLWLLEAIEKQTQIKDSAIAEVRQLDDELGIKKLRVNALAAVEEAQRNSSNIAILRDILATTRADYEATQKKRDEAWHRARQEEEKLGQIRAGNPPEQRP